MKLLSQKQKQVDYEKVNLKSEIDGLLQQKKGDTTQEASKLSFQKELKKKIDLLDSVTEGFGKQSSQIDSYLNSLRERVRKETAKVDEFVGSLDGKLAPLKEDIEGKAQVLKEVLGQTEDSILSLKEKEAETQHTLAEIRRNIEAQSRYAQKAYVATKEFEAKKNEVEEAKREVDAYFTRKTQEVRELEKTLQTALQAVQEQVAVLARDKAQVESSKPYFEKLFVRLGEFEKKLTKREKLVTLNAKGLKDKAKEAQGEIDELERRYGALVDFKTSLSEAQAVYVKEKAKAEDVSKKAERALNILKGQAKGITDLVKDKRQEISEAKQELEAEKAEVQSSKEEMRSAKELFVKWEQSVKQQIAEFEEAKTDGKQEVEVITKETNTLLSDLQGKIQELKDQQVLSENASKELVEVKNVANGYISLARKEKKNLAELQKQQEEYFSNKKQEIEKEQKALNLEKSRANATKDRLENIESKLAEWDKRLADREAVLKTGFEELQWHKQAETTTE